MTKKIVAIGGGENGRIDFRGKKRPYEIREIDEEIIKLSGKDCPNVLFLGHAQISFSPMYETRYIETIKKIYKDILKCNYKSLTIEELKNDFNKAKELVEWADIIYEGGGDTPAMIDLWHKTGFDVLLKDAWNKGKVMCGISAGAICWFSCGFTDNPEYMKKEVNKVDALGFINAYFSPHSQKVGKKELIIKSLKHIDKVGILLSNCTAIEIIDDKYRIIKTKPIEGKYDPFALKSYWKDGDYHEENIDSSSDLKPLDELLSRNI